MSDAGTFRAREAEIKAHALCSIFVRVFHVQRPKSWIRYHSVVLNYIRKCSECYVDGNAYQFWLQVCSSIMYAHFSKCAHQSKSWKIAAIHKSATQDWNRVTQLIEVSITVYQQSVLWKDHRWKLTAIIWYFMIKSGPPGKCLSIFFLRPQLFISTSIEQCFPLCLCKFLVRL